MVVLLALLLVVGLTPAQSAAAADNELQIKIDPSLLVRVRADPLGSYAVIARGSAGGNAPVGVGLDGQNGQNGQNGQSGAASSDRAVNAVGRAGATAGQNLSVVGATSAVLSGRQILSLARDGSIARIVPDAVFSVTWEGSDAAEAVTSPSTLSTNAPAAWSSYGISGRGVGVAVLDSGVAAHPDLGSRIVASVDLVTGDGTTSATPLGDAGGHGTHVAGIIAGDGTASRGAYSGIAPRASIVSVRVIDALGTTYLSRVLGGMQWILNNRAAFNIRVLNISFGAPAQSGYQGDLLAAAAENLNFGGILVVAAAGNGGGRHTIVTPALDPYVLAVGAMDDHGSNNLFDYRVTPWSSRGTTPFDGLAKPDLIAPGRQVLSLRVPGSTLDLLLPDHRVVAPGDIVARYFTLSGTSMAAPAVAGAAALLIERYPSITTAQLRYQLKVTARPLGGGATVFDQGAGLIDVLGAAARIPAAVPALNLPVSDAFALQSRPYLKGQPLKWINPGFNGGVDTNARHWSDVTWDNIAWDGITWQNLSWEAFTWQGITWQGITWQGITWQGVTWQGVTWQGITWAGITWLSAPRVDSGDFGQGN